MPPHTNFTNCKNSGILALHLAIDTKINVESMKQNLKLIGLGGGNDYTHSHFRPAGQVNFDLLLLYLSSKQLLKKCSCGGAIFLLTAATNTLTMGREQITWISKSVHAMITWQIDSDPPRSSRELMG